MVTLAPSKYFEIEKFSHHFVVKNMSPSGQKIVEAFARNYIQYGMIKVGRVFKRGPLKVFASRTACKNESRFHIGQYESWKNHLLERGVPSVSYTEMTYGFTPAAPLGAVLADGWIPKDYQGPIIDYLESPLPESRKLVEIQTGMGKAQSVRAKVKIPGGWTTNGELSVGDNVVMQDGSTSFVTGIFPQGFKDIFRVTYEDGRQADFCAEHLWLVYIKQEATGETEPKIVDTKEVIRLLVTKKAAVFIDLIDSEIGLDIETSQDPYLFGKDGDIEEGLGEYLCGSHAQRLGLLQGILENDSEIDSEGAISITVKELGLAQQIQYLARSLGCVAFLNIADVSAMPSDITGTTFRELGYTVEIWHKSPSALFCTTRPDLDKLSLAQLKLEVLSIVPHGVEEAQCISVDHPDRLYITNDFVVTHNTFCAAAAIANIGHRIVAFLKPKYLEKWVDDLNKLLGISSEDIAVIQGAASLMDVISQAREGTLTAKAILISNRTFQSFMNNYEDKGDAVIDMGYGCIPSELIQVLQCGIKLVDEVHEDFHLNFKIDLYTHVERSISLSATLVSEDDVVSKMHKVAYPQSMRYSGLAYQRYVSSYAMRYRIKGGEFLRSTEQGSNNYSHIAFEKNFFKNATLLKAYLELIAYRFEAQWLTRYEKGQRCLIYAASIQMCTLITDYLKKRYSDLDIRRYVEDDPYANLMQADVCVSTIGSAGTGHDIAQLITVLMTVSIASKASNIQGFGRLRNLIGWEMIFEYFTCMDIAKQVEYHERKEILLASMAKTSVIENLHYVLGK